MSGAAAYQWRGGQWSEADQISVADRGFRHGMSLFETIACFDGAPRFFEEHVGRLREACDQVGFAWAPAAAENLPALLAAWGGTGVARFCVTAGPGAIGNPPASGTTLVQLEERTPWQTRTVFTVQTDPTPLRDPLPGFKTGNYWGHALALERARAAGHDEALLFDEAGALISGSISNVFVYAGGIWSTPDRAAGCRAGVTREWLCHHAEVRERDITRADLSNAEAVLLTNSWIGLQPVSALEARPLASTAIAADLLRAYHGR